MAQQKPELLYPSAAGADHGNVPSLSFPLGTAGGATRTLKNKESANPEGGVGTHSEIAA